MEREKKEIRESGTSNRKINCQVIPVAGYVMNVCNREENDLGEMDMIMKSVLRREGFQEDKP